MSRFNKAPVKAPPARGFIVTDTRASGRTHEGAPGFARDLKSEFFLLAVSHMVSQTTFYETGAGRDGRYLNLVRQVAVQDPVWTAGFLGWLRNTANMRTASLVGALEAAKVMVEAKIPGSRAIVNSALQRADEPGEALGYWIQKYGRTNIPKPVKRGIADAVERLYTQYALLKYDTPSHGIRFADVLELTHPTCSNATQSQLYQFAVDRRHGHGKEPGELLKMVFSQQAVREAVAGGDYSPLLSTGTLHATGFTWQDVLSMAGSKVSKAKLWEALIPTMGIMAQIRNLRGMDQAGVSNAAAQLIINRLMDAEEIAKSKQFPFRFLSAYRATQDSLRWGHALDVALTHSVSNIPELPGRTLILVDRSGSMFMKMNKETELTLADTAAVFGGALAMRNKGRATLVEFGTTPRDIAVPLGGGSLLKLVEKFTSRGGTNTLAATRAHFRHATQAGAHDRVVLITDEQSQDGDPGSYIPAGIPLHVWGLGGYKYSHTPGAANRFAYGGLTDQSFQLIPLVEHGVSQSYPWEQSAQAAR